MINVYMLEIKIPYVEKYKKIKYFTNKNKAYSYILEYLDSTDCIYDDMIIESCNIDYENKKLVEASNIIGVNGTIMFSCFIYVLKLNY